MADEGAFCRVDGDFLEVGYRVRWKTIEAALSKHVDKSSKHPSSKLTWKEVTAIRDEYSLNGPCSTVTHKQLADKYGVSPGTVGRILRNEMWVEND